MATELVNCPSCGAANPPRAEWCGQCYVRFAAPSSPSDGPVADAAVGDAGSTGDRDVGDRSIGEAALSQWVCPRCDHTNHLTDLACRLCGATITEALAPESIAVPAPTNPRWWHPIVPGWGLVRAGRGIEGAVLAIIVIMALSAATVFLGSGRSIGWVLLVLGIVTWAAGELEVRSPGAGLVTPRLLSVMGALVTGFVVVGVLTAVSAIGGGT